MFDLKALKRAKFQVVRKIDAIDREAEAQGNATRFFSENVENTMKGRRGQKNQRNRSRGAAIVGSKRVTAFTQDHTAANEKYLIG